MIITPVPLLAGHLAAPAGGAKSSIEHDSFLRHDEFPFQDTVFASQTFRTFTGKVFRDFIRSIS
jgi:hypothetical protein